MNINRLNSLYYKKKDIAALEEELAELNNLGSAPLNDMPKGKKVSRPTENYLIRKSVIVDKLKKAYDNYFSEYEIISDFINQIRDDEVRLIARLRFIKNKDWFYIAEEISPEDKSLHWTTPRKKLKSYLEKEKVEQ